MGGGQCAASYEAKMRLYFGDAGEHILHVLRYQVGARSRSEVEWRAIRNAFACLIVTNSWTFRDPIRQLSNVMERIGYQHRTLLSPFMRDALNGVRALNKLPKGEELHAYNIGNLDMYKTMQPTMDRCSDTEELKEIIGLGPRAELRQFLESWAVAEDSFIHYYRVMYLLMTKRQFDLAQEIPDPRNLDMLAALYFKRAYMRWGLTGRERTQERPLIATVWAWNVFSTTTWNAIVPNTDDGSLEVWDIYAVRRLIEEFAREYLGPKTYRNLWIDQLRLPENAAQDRPSDEPWSLSYQEQLDLDLTDEQKEVKARVNSSLRKILGAGNALKIGTLPRKIRDDVTDIFTDMTDVSNISFKRSELRSSQCSQLVPRWPKPSGFSISLITASVSVLSRLLLDILRSSHSHIAAIHPTDGYMLSTAIVGVLVQTRQCVVVQTLNELLMHCTVAPDENSRRPLPYQPEDIRRAAHCGQGKRNVSCERCMHY